MKIISLGKDIKKFLLGDIMKGGQAVAERLLTCPICGQKSIDPDSGDSLCDCEKCLLQEY